jgi:uncharacterized protein YbbC (DUF1343 family)
VGRGTDTPFEVIGAPWIDGRRLAGELNRAELAGVRFVPTFFTPISSKFKDERCGGVQIVITDRKLLLPLRVGFELARRLRELYREAWQMKDYDRLLVNAAVFKAVAEGQSARAIEAIYESDLNAFLKRRERYLLYK